MTVMRDKKTLGFGVVVLLLAAAVTVLPARADVKPQDPLSAYIGQCVWILTAMGGFPGTLRADGDRFLKVDVPSPYVSDVNANPVLVGWRQVIAIGAAPSAEACAETGTVSFDAPGQPLLRLDVSGRR
jgi:hypothetical protein